MLYVLLILLPLLPIFYLSFYDWIEEKKKNVYGGFFKGVN